MNCKELLTDIRLHCLKCDNARKLVESHCNDKKCSLFKWHKKMLDDSKQLSMFTYEGFVTEVESIIKKESCSWLEVLYFSEIRVLIEEYLRGKCIKIPDGAQKNSWWGKVASHILPKNGWKRVPEKYRYTDKRGLDFAYYRRIMP